MRLNEIIQQESVDILYYKLKRAFHEHNMKVDKGEPNLAPANLQNWTDKYGFFDLVEHVLGIAAYGHTKKTVEALWKYHKAHTLGGGSTLHTVYDTHGGKFFPSVRYKEDTWYDRMASGR